jgi:hypothetical protein
MVRTFDTRLRLQTLEGKNASGSLQAVRPRVSPHY